MDEKLELGRAIGRDDIDAVRSYVELNPDMISTNAPSGCPFLIVAVRERKYEIAKFLLKKGARVDARGQRGETAFHYPGNIKVSQFLLEGGADTEARDEKGLTPLHWHCGPGQEEFDGVELLISRGAEIDARDSRGCTPLHHAISMAPICYTNWEAKEFAPKIAQFLLRHGADINAKDLEGKTPLHLAAYRGLEEECRVLLDHGADVNPLNKNGFTPLDLCYRSVSEG